MAVVASQSQSFETSKTESTVDPTRPPSLQSIGDTSSDSSSDPSSDRRELDLINQGLVNRSEEYRLLFRLPCDEVFVQDFNCALQDNILLQGHMYLFVRHVCFYSNIFGYETKKIIPLNEVTAVRRAKTAGIFPNAIEIMAGEKKNFFGSFLSRDEAYRLITEGWAQQNPDAKAFLDRQDSSSSNINGESINGSPKIKEETDISSSDRNVETNGSVSKANANGSTIANNNNNNGSTIPNINNGGTSANNNNNNDNDDNNNNGEEIIVLKKPSDNNEICENGNGNGNGNDAPNVVSTDVFISETEDSDAPDVPEGYTMIAEAKFPIGVEEFYKLFISDDSFDFLEDVHKKCGDKEFQVSKWIKNEQNVYVRNVSLQHPIKIYLEYYLDYFIGAKFGSTKQVQKLRVYKDNHIVIETSQTIADAPFGDCFSVEGRWDVERDSTTEENGCKLTVYLYVLFVKRTMFRGKIDQATKDECKDVYGLWIKLAKEALANKIASQPKGETPTNIITTHDLNVDTNQTETSQNNETNLENIEPTENGIANGPQIAPELTPIVSTGIVYTENSTQFNSDKSPSSPSVSFSSVLREIMSVLREILGVFLSFTKSSRFPAFLLAAFVALFILMQVSIIILLTRTPNVYVVNEGSNYVSNTGGYTRETTEYLEKRFNYLKEEMRLVQSQMERMGQEYAWLKSHMENLEKLSKDKS